MLSLLYGPALTSIHDYWKNYDLTMQTFVSKVMSLLLNTLSRLVIAFLPRSKCLLISWLQSPSTVILKSESEVAQSCLTLCNPIDRSPRGSPTMEFSRQEYWNGLPFPSPGDLPDPGIEPGSPTL